MYVHGGRQRGEIDRKVKAMSDFEEAIKYASGLSPGEVWGATTRIISGVTKLLGSFSF